MKAELQGIKAEAEDELRRIGSPDELETLRVKYLGRKGILSELLAKIPSLPAEQRPEMGRLLNELKKDITSRYEGAKTALLDMQRPKAVGPVQDVTLPGRRPPLGHKHPLIQTIEDIKDIFADMGFQVAFGPEVELEFYNFEALNMPAHHPARDMWDTLYLNLPGGAEPLLLRTHTSPMQIRVMEKQKPPVRVVVPGKVYRHDNPDASHSFMFHQIEGLAVDRDITFGDLKGVLDHFLREFFGPQTRTRFVPSYFPFTEPSADVHGSCHVCGSAGCRVCKFTGWIELVGCGMVDPNVYGFVGYDAQQLSGFAFGMGVDRFAMLKYGIDDIQLFFQNDVRFLTQFRR